MKKVTKNTIKKSEMNGQSMDMQPTRGGIPSRLTQASMDEKDLIAGGFRYVVGRTGWMFFGRNNIQPIDLNFIHKTDIERIKAYRECLYLLRQARDVVEQGKRTLSDYFTESEVFKFCHLTVKYGFSYRPMYKKTIKALTKAYN